MHGKIDELYIGDFDTLEESLILFSFFSCHTISQDYTEN